MCVWDVGVCWFQLTVLGTPAEEGGGGKVDLIEAGVFKDYDLSMMSHPCPFDDKTADIMICIVQ